MPNFFQKLMPGATGAAGAAGTQWRVGAGVPSNALGVNGDLYLNSSNGDYYQKSAGAYALQGNLGGGGGGVHWLSGSGAPSTALGVTGDVYFDITAKVIYGPKTAGSWGAGTSLKGDPGVPGSGGDAIYYKATNAFPANDGNERGGDLTNLLRTQGHVALPVATSNPWNSFGSGDFRVGLTQGPIKVPTFASLVGRNSWISANAVGTAEFSIIQLEYDDAIESGAAQSGARCLLDGVSANGRAGQLGAGQNTFVIGFNLSTPDRNHFRDYTAGHSALHTTKLSATLCYFGYYLLAGQYSFHEDWRCTNSTVAAVVDGTSYGGGNVDMPTLRHWNFWNNTLGIAMIGCPAGLPVSENIISGVWSKQGTGCAFAAFHDPWNVDPSNPNRISGEGSRFIIHGGSTEYNVTGKNGENATRTITFKRLKAGTPADGSPERYTTFVPDEYYTVNIPRVDVWIQRNFRLRFEQYAFQSNTNKGGGPYDDRGDELLHVPDGSGNHTSSCVFEFNAEPGIRSGIICMLDGPFAVLEVGNCDFPWQQVYSVRARDEQAWIEFLGPLTSAGGIFENVKVWPTAFLMNPNEAPHGNFPFGIVFSGWGGTAKVDNSDCPSVLDPTYYTNSYIQAPQLAQPAGDHATSGITAGTQTEPIPYTYSGSTPVGYFEFAAGNVDATARTRYLCGGDLPMGSFGAWDDSIMRRFGTDPTGHDRLYWWITNIEVYNTHVFPVRLLMFLDSVGSDYTIAQQVLGCDPTLRTKYVPAAVTLWPQQWMRLTILACPSGDRRLNFMRLDHTGETVRILCRNLGSFRPPESSRHFLNRALHAGYYSLR